MFRNLLYFRAELQLVCFARPQWSWMMDMINTQIIWLEHLRQALTKPCPNCKVMSIGSNLARYGNTDRYLLPSSDADVIPAAGSEVCSRHSSLLYHLLSLR